MTAQQFDIVALVQWVGGPTGHQVELGIVAFEGTQPVWVDGSIERLIRTDLGNDWTLADFAWRFRGGLVSNAYGNPWFERRTLHGFPHSSLGIQAQEWTVDAETAAILAVGTDCRETA